MAIFVGLLLAILIQVSVARASDEKDLTYTLTETWIEGGGGETKLEVHQSGNVAVARNESGDVALVSDPAAGIVSAGKGSRFSGFSSLGFLVEMFEVPAAFGPGTELPMGDDQLRRVESIDFKLERGDSDRTLEGRQVQHHVLTIDLEVRPIDAGNEGELEYATGRADLWAAPDLPFSWLSYNSPNGYLWSLPLSFNYREAAAHVASELADDLMELGLLVRAEIKSTTSSDSGFEMTFLREVSVEGLRASTDPLDKAAFNQPVISLTKATTILGSMMLAGMSCEEAATSGDGSLEVSSDGAPGVSAQGTAWLSPDTQGGASSTLVVGTLGETEMRCVVLVAEPAGLQVGTYPVLSPEASQAATGNRASVVFARGNRASMQLTLLDSGSLTLAEADSGELHATVNGEGWTAALSPGSPSITEDVPFSLAFTIAAPVAQSAATDPSTPAPTQIAAWTPMAFDPTLAEPAGEWTFGGKGVKAGAIDPLGRVAAVAVRDEMRVALIDLDSLSESGSIEVEGPAHGDPVSALAFAPSGDRLAIGMPMGTVRIVDVSSRETLQQLQYSPDGSSFTPVKPMTFDGSAQHLFGYTSGRVVIWDTESGEEILAWQETGALDDLEVTPDGSRVAATVVSTSMKIVDASTGSELCSLPGDFSRLAMHPSGDRLAVWSFSDGLMVASTEDCRVLATWPTETKFAPELAWASDGEHVILGSLEGALYIHSSTSGEKVGTWNGQGKASFVYAATGSNRILSTAMGDGSKAMVWSPE